jgi:hypothetical protein
MAASAGVLDDARMPQVVAQTVSQRANRLILLDVRLLHNAGIIGAIVTRSE